MSEEKVYCSMYSRNAELYHHGIKGQKWGVRNGPPYPLGSEKGSSRSVKEKRLNNDFDGEIKEKGFDTINSIAKKSLESKYIPNDKEFQKRNIALELKEMQIGKDIDEKTKEFLSITNNISEYADNMFKISEEEAKKVIKTKKFKDDLDRRLFESFGNGVDDEDLFEFERDDLIYEMIREKEYSPKAKEMLNKLYKDINNYYDDIDLHYKDYFGSDGDKVIPGFEKDKLTYNDIIKELYYEKSGASFMHYLYNHAEDYQYEDIDYVPEYMNIYTMDEYNRKHSEVK